MLGPTVLACSEASGPPATFGKPCTPDKSDCASPFTCRAYAEDVTAVPMVVCTQLCKTTAVASTASEWERRNSTRPSRVIVRG